MAKTIDEILGTAQSAAVPRADTSAVEAELKAQLEDAKEQASAKVDQSVAENVTALHTAQKEAEEGFAAQRAQIDLDEALAKNPQKAEYLLPILIGELLEQKKVTVKVLPTRDRWFGVTYAADREAVAESFRALIDAGEYREDLYSDL